ncbi:MAG: bifunctional folylpolyglutamate synthase/dihydrofolate synthase [Clostridiales bacterium]|jgi:dihydrofolate synthase/folylpolyglutamate synthase|nr:bifunctional folylpolyglutamate synthase/dihydrofolate synthase [Clostridiales bacterium]
MTYQQALDFIHSRLRFGSKLGLDTTKTLLRRLGDPHKKLKFIHVAGTNGKGSTSAYLANILMANGYKTGMYISPFVHSFTERIQINGRQIPQADLARHTAAVAAVIDDGFYPTEFEIVTAIGFLHFLSEGCDFVVLEVGLGGRFDATNVIPPPLVAVITSISIDHTELLGDTVARIAFEKCGIIKTGSAVAVYPDNPQEALEVIHNTARTKGASVTVGDKDAVRVLRSAISGTLFSYKGERSETAMLGRHQVYNAVTAITAAERLGLGLRLQEGIQNTRFGGRLEIVRHNPLTLIDGAHNYSGVLALKNALEVYFPRRNIILVMGMLRDKEYERCVCEIAPLASLFIATEPDNPRALPATELESVAKQRVSATRAFARRQDAVDYALNRAGAEDIVCVCGSLYLIGNLKF